MSNITRAHVWFYSALFAACGPVNMHADECACGKLGTVEASALVEPAAQKQDALYGNRTYFWPAARAALPATSRTDINVCWENPNAIEIGATPAARVAWLDSRRRAIEESWSRHARINFTGWTTCVSSSRGLRVRLCVANDPACPAWPGSQAGGGYPTIDGLKNGIRLNPDHSPAVIVHEFGHALGFYHEEERFNTTQNMGTTACDTSGKQSGWTNNAPATVGGFDRDSVMAYCSPPDMAPWLSTNDVSSIQRVYGRRQRGSLVTPRGKCAAARAAVGQGDHGFLWSCDEYGDDQEFLTQTTLSSGDAFNLRFPSSNYCLEADGSYAGSAVSLWTCSGVSQIYDWRFENIYVRGFGGLCLDLAGGSLTTGTPINVWECGALGGANQRWTVMRSGQLRYGTSAFCAVVSGTGALVIGYCNGNDDAQRFVFSAGTIRRKSNSNACLDVQGPNDQQYAVFGTSGAGAPRNGAPVQQFQCNTALNQAWSFNGAIRFDANASLCLSRAADSSGAGLSLQSCNNSAETQEWDYYF